MRGSSTEILLSHFPIPLRRLQCTVFADFFLSAAIFFIHRKRLKKGFVGNWACAIPSSMLLSRSGERQRVWDISSNHTMRQLLREAMAVRLLRETLYGVSRVCPKFRICESTHAYLVQRQQLWFHKGALAQSKNHWKDWLDGTRCSSFRPISIHVYDFSKTSWHSLE